MGRLQKLYSINAVKKKVKLDQVIGEAEEKFAISEVLEVPCMKPPIEQVITVIVENVAAEYEILKDKVLVEGAVCVKILYVADMSEHPNTYQQPVFAFEGAVPFSEVLNIPCVRDNGASACVEVTVEDIKTSMVGMGINNPCDTESSEEMENKRKVRVRMVIEIEVDVMKVKEVCLVTDLKGSCDNHCHCF